MDYLVFRLYGPMASWGDIAIGESRHSHPGPTKAAVMGLVAAALGIKREQEAQHQALNRGYQMATAVQPGQLLRDYHTVQAPDSVGKFRYRTRRDELILGKERLGTVLSAREYRTDAEAWVALKPASDAPFSLDALANALNNPIFVPYLGRKACPLAAPMEPQHVTADNFSEAFAAFKPVVTVFTPADGLTEHYWEGELSDFCDDPAQHLQTLQIVVHDKLLSRQRWQFAPRHLYHLSTMEVS